MLEFTFKKFDTPRLHFVCYRGGEDYGEMFQGKYCWWVIRGSGLYPMPFHTATAAERWLKGMAELESWEK